MKIINDTTLMKLRDQIADHTNWNRHNYSVLELAKFLKDSNKVLEIEEIILQHDAFGHMPMDLIEKRGEIKYELLEQFRNTYGEKAYRVINNAY
jgi:2,3-bisphosphoglycerate-independent phosphoglycerate mutase